MSSGLPSYIPASGLPLADTSDMPSLHRVFRNALGDAPALVASAEEPERVELVGSYFANVLRLLHVHHEGEDELLTPRLLERLPDEADDIRSVAGEHAGVTAPLGAAETAVSAWITAPSDAAAAEVVRTLGVLEAGLVPHLDREEQVVLPLAGRCIDVAEWGELPAAGMAGFTGDKIWLILGLIREQLSPAKLAEMDAHMPPPVKEFWTSTGQGLFDGYVGRLRAAPGQA